MSGSHEEFFFSLVHTDVCRKNGKKWLVSGMNSLSKLIVCLQRHLEQTLVYAHSDSQILLLMMLLVRDTDQSLYIHKLVSVHIVVLKQ